MHLPMLMIFCLLRLKQVPFVIVMPWWRDNGDACIL